METIKEKTKSKSESNNGIGIIIPLLIMAVGIIVSLYVLNLGYSTIEKQTTEEEHEIGETVKFYDIERGNQFQIEQLDNGEVWELKHITSSFLSPNEYYYERIE